MDACSTTLTFFALTLLVASWIMLIFAATSDDFTWGLFSVFLPPLAYFYGLYKWELAGDSIKAAMLGFAVLIIAQLV